MGFETLFLSYGCGEVRFCDRDFGRFRSEGASVGVDVVARRLAIEVGGGRQWCCQLEH